MGGLAAMYAWRSIYWNEQVSSRTRSMLMIDWIVRWAIMTFSPRGRMWISTIDIVESGDVIYPDSERSAPERKSNICFLYCWHLWSSTMFASLRLYCPLCLSRDILDVAFLPVFGCNVIYFLSVSPAPNTYSAFPFSFALPFSSRTIRFNIIFFFQ